MGLGVGVLCVSTALAAAEHPLAVLVTSERSGSASYSTAIAKTVSHELERAHAGPLLSEADAAARLAQSGSPKAKSCNGSRPCLSKLAAGLGNAVLVAVDVGKLGSKLVVHLEALIASSEPLAVLDFSAAVSSYAVDANGPIVLFADSLNEKLKALTPPPPLQPVRVEPPPPPLAVERPPAPPPRAHASLAMPIALLAVGVVGAGVGAGFTIDGLQAKSSYDNSFLTNGMPFLGPDGKAASHLSQPQLDSLRAHGNTSFTVALISGAAGAALLALSLWLFLSN